MSAEDRLAALERLQGLLIESLGLWAGEDPDLDRLAGLAAEGEALAAGLAALPEPPGGAAAVAAAASEAERLRAALAAAAAEHDAVLRRAWADEQRREAALRSASRAGLATGEARFLDDRR